MADLFGTAGDDLVIGTAGGDRLSGGGPDLATEGDDAGSDSLTGCGGTDLILGWAGNDTLAAAADGAGSTLLGGAGDDSLDGGDAFFGYGEEGNDTILGTSLPDRRVLLDGGAGKDLLMVTGPGDNLLLGGAGDDTIRGGDGNDDIDDGWIGYGLYERVADSMEGGSGDDTIHSNGGADTIEGGDGFDRLVLDRSGDGVGLAFRPKADGAARFGGGGSVAGVEQFQVLGTAHRDTLHGLLADDTLDGDYGDDSLNGGGGADLLSGADGNDILHGGAGHDRLVGGWGDDTLIAAAGRDTLDGTGSPLDHDVFRWITLLGVDEVVNLDAAQDVLEFTSAALGGLLPAGTLDPAHFASGAATAAVPQFLFDAAAGLLRWDPDGTGAGTATTVLRFTGGP